MTLQMMMFGLGGGPVDPVVTLANQTNSNFRATGTCHAKFRIGSDGDWYESDNVGNFGAAGGTWLTQGASNQVWVERTMLSASDTLDVDGIGASRVACTSNRDFGYERSTTGLDSGTVQLDFYDAASGGTLLDTANITLSADRG